MSQQFPPSSQRRSFLTSLNAGITSLAAIALGSAAVAQAKTSAPVRFEPARHDKDDWLEKPAKHRLVFDTIEPVGFGEALAFAYNYINVNGADYAVQPNELAVVIVARNRSTPFAYNDKMWAKYGKPMAARARFEDPKTKEAPIANLFNSENFGEGLSNRGATLDMLSKQGAHLAVCSVATKNFAGAIAQALGGNAADINSELIANLQSNARMVPAGIVATSRAQERGYTLVRS